MTSNKIDNHIRPAEQVNIVSKPFHSNNNIPNHPGFPLLLYRNALHYGSSNPSNVARSVLRKNQWEGIWENGIYTYHHYHSLAHETLILARGDADVLFGGKDGEIFSLTQGDIAILPAGTGHKKLESKSSLLVVGGYPPGQRCDLKTAKNQIEQQVLDNIKAVNLPETDPLYGSSGPLHEHWQ